ncbi:tripartite ATP-independent periplasmic transporter DctQ component [Jeotgalibacillus malaysiensis]|uniref:Tripartite ATP-independent periplasmic transporter DctQ component n=1 Tax=Jeotgalibacillus malaysiensis TaxID=1508404 RepID=A0A0B5AXJ8_9BACL|nr:TRAP transporter small permease [Jeotgalibacillus malaysiensis]AJD92744.1 tripartite ATP-independent periplasmic transporter DctQ component [Jeotgalibacillus malaysiensis]
MSAVHKKTWIDRVVDGLDFIASIMMVVLTIVVFGEVLSRYVFDLPLVFSNELTLLLFPWVIFIAAIAVTKNEGHLSINFFRSLMPKAVQRWMFAFSKLVMLFFSVYMSFSAYRMGENTASQVMPVLRISKTWLITSVSISFAVISLILIYQFVMIVLGKLEVPDEEEMLDDLDHGH